MSATLYRDLGIKWGMAFLMVWIYYTVWVVGIPFFEGTYIPDYFPARRFAIEGPILIGTVFTMGIAYYLGKVVADDALTRQPRVTRENLS